MHVFALQPFVQVPPAPSSDNRITPNIIRRHAHIRINRGRKRRETRTPQRRSLRPTTPRQETSSQTPSSHPISEIVLRAVTLNRALCAREDGADVAEILGRGPRGAAHFLETLAELFFDGEGGDGGAGRVGGHGGVVAHRGHEEAEDAAEAEAHYAGHGELAGAGLHCCLHLKAMLVSRLEYSGLLRCWCCPYVFDRLLLLHGFEVGAAAVHAAHTSHAGHTRERHVDDGAGEDDERKRCG
jgi:hypothetical protein